MSEDSATFCCSTPDLGCRDSRMKAGYRRRRYRCRACGEVFSTMERRVEFQHGTAGQELAQASAFGVAAAEELQDIKTILKMLVEP